MKSRLAPSGIWLFTDLLLALLVTIGNSTVLGQATPQARPNILFIFSDDHAYQATGCYGSVLNQTPHIDRIAREGMRFDRCLVTNSICGPSRATILTGKYSHLNGFRQNGDRFDGNQVTLPKLLNAAGYQSALIGKWHLVSEPTGFDHWLVLPDQGAYYNPKFLSAQGEIKTIGYVTESITERALDWLDNHRDPKRPFLLMVQHKAPHREWMPGPKQLELFRDTTFPEPPTLFDDYANRSAVLGENEMEIGRHMRPGEDLKLWQSESGSAAAKAFFSRFTEEQKSAWQQEYSQISQRYFDSELNGDERTRFFYQRYLQDYLRCVAAVDESVGQLLNYLDRNGLTDNTLVIYASDQGFYLGEHGWYDKRWAFEQSLRTPLVMRWPGRIAPGSQCSAMVSNLDFPETILAAAGISIPSEMQGRALQPLLSGTIPEDWRKSFYYRYYELGTHNVAAHEALITDRYKLIHYTRRLNAEQKPEEIDQWDLMDLQVDPLELRSFMQESSYAKIQEELSTELRRIKAELKAD